METVKTAQQNSKAVSVSNIFIIHYEFYKTK